MRNPILAAITFLLVAFCAVPAFAQITVTITGVTPSNGVISADGSATIAWTIDASGISGTYEAVVGGDGTPGTGSPLSSSNAGGSFSGTKTGETTVLASDLGDGGAFTIYVIAVNSADATDYGSASTTVTLDIPPGVVTGLSAGSGDSRIFLSWSSGEATNITSYLVYYATHHGDVVGDYDGADSASGTSPINVGDVTDFILDGLSNGQEYFIRVTAVSDLNEESEPSEEVTAIPALALGAADMAKDTKGCFIATAAFGSYDDPYVMRLRGFRDKILLKSEAGRSFVNAYYHYSPPIAAIVARHPAVRWSVRMVLRPLSLFATILMSPLASFLTVLLTLILSIFGLFLVRRNVRHEEI